MSEARLKSIWNNMKSRCFNIKNNQFKDYGGRGIKVNYRWLIFENFLNDMLPSYEILSKDKYITLERIDNDGDYCKENCKWATLAEQATNRRDNRYHLFNGEKITQSELARRLGISRQLLYKRLKKHWSFEKIIKNSPYMKDGIKKELKRRLLEIRNGAFITPHLEWILEKLNK